MSRTKEVKTVVDEVVTICICDGCSKKVEAVPVSDTDMSARGKKTTFYLPLTTFRLPDGWLLVAEAAPEREAIFCSPACMMRSRFFDQVVGIQERSEQIQV